MFKKKLTEEQRLFFSLQNSDFGDSVATVTHVPASHRRLIRRRLPALFSNPSPSKEMRKKKPKKSSPSKSAKSPDSPPPAKSSPPSNKALPKIDVEELSSPVNDEVFDAHIGSPADVDAQPTRDSLDLSSHLVDSLSEKIVIIEKSMDPTSEKDEALNTQNESSYVAPPTSSCESLPVVTEVKEAAVVTGSSNQLANVEAKGGSLSSQLADLKEPSLDMNVEKEEGNVIGASLTPSALSGPQNSPEKTQAAAKDTWCDRARGVKQLSKKGEAFILPSGEACVKIPNSVIEKNRKAWERFVLGQFYSDPPSQGTLHNIVNGIWSKHYHDIAVSKMEEPGITPTKPELTSAPIWLELRNVPFQFFNEDGLERIAGLFDSGVISRVLVSSLWMPQVCGFCKEIDHSTKRCPTAFKPCSLCDSTEHASDKPPGITLPPLSVQSKTSLVEVTHQSKLGTEKDKARGEPSGTASYLQPVIPRSASGTSRLSLSDVQPDSSDFDSTDSELEEACVSASLSLEEPQGTKGYTRHCSHGSHLRRCFLCCFLNPSKNAAKHSSLRISWR
ncbi:hypothetical protein Bca4012_083152 [Brassica carinata]